MKNRKYKILVSAPLDFIPDLKDKIGLEMSVVYGYGADKEKTRRLLQDNDFDAWMVSPCPTYRVDKEMIDPCLSLKVISSPSTGSDHIDVDYAKSKGIMVYALKGTREVEEIYASSEYTFTLLASAIRRLPQAYKAALEGKWRESESRFRGRELHGLALGIVGLGRIGANLAKYALAFGMNVLAYDPYKRAEDARIEQTDSLDELLSKIDALAVCIHLNKETYKMIDDRIFAKLKNGVYFINTSRGDVVDEEALLKYLENGKIGVAALDVTSGEITNDKNMHPLIKYARTHDNLIITPHIGGLTFDSERKAQTAAYEAIKKYLTEKGEGDAIHSGNRIKSQR